MPASEILWINHAGYELRTGGLRIAHDPWLFGLAFGNGWALLSESRYRPEDFAGVDYLWFSHEHPDHFSPGVLKQIPEETRRGITVLFQETKDKRVAGFCRKLGFRVQELPDGERVALNDQVAVTCGTVLGRDSWLFLEGPDATFLNANDCVGVDWTKVAAALGRPVDVLLTQFSFAQWVGNPDDEARIRAAARIKYTEMRAQIDAFQPGTVIPFASYVWFCAPENFFMNRYVNRIGDVARTLEEWQVSCTVLYPGDIFAPGTAHDSSEAIHRYDADRASHSAPLALDEQPVPLAELHALSGREQERLKSANRLWMLAPLRWTGFVKPVNVYLTDLGVGLRYSMFGGILADGRERGACDLACSSVSFAAMLKSGYGFGTLSINGRAEELTPGAFGRVSRHFAVAARNEEGESIPGVFLKTDYLLFQIRKALGLERKLTV